MPNPRETARDTLDCIVKNQWGFEEAFAKSGGERLAERDRNFVRALVMLVLRRQGMIDALLKQFIARPLPPKLTKVLWALRLGAAQLLWMDTPAHAAVNEAVTITPNSHKGLVNAVLKRVAAEGKAALAAIPAMTGTPAWLYESWCGAYGKAPAHRIIEAQMQEPPLDVSVKADAEEWAKRLNANLLPTGSLRLRDAGKITSLPGYDKGAWWVQDAAAALPALLLGDVQDKQVLDICAAPGGKTAQLAARGARVTAIDSSEPRMKILRSNMQRLQLSAACVVEDIMHYPFPAPFDAILLDAPCSATGTIRRHPEIIHSRTPEYVEEQSVLQLRMIRYAVTLLKPCGVLVYCVCSLQAEEGERHLDIILSEIPEVSLRPILLSEIAGRAELITARGELRTTPAHFAEYGGMDGFYAVRLVRNA